MAHSNVAKLVVDTLATAGVRRIYGVVGDSLNGITECLRKQDRIEWIGVGHEEVAAFAAGAEAHLTARHPPSALAQEDGPQAPRQGRLALPEDTTGARRSGNC
jgi:thiamine pyrophosphate-dependent acetolactate synthase large subunit-like protein